MPEGDTIHRLALRLGPVLEDREVTAFTARRLPAADRTLVGRRISKVYARGKNLLIAFDGGYHLHIHLKMHGRVFIERTRSSFWAPEKHPPDMRLVVPGAAIVGRHLPLIRLLTEAQVKRAADLASLGPDLVTEGFDEGDAVKRLRQLSIRDIASALLVQRAAAGIGNVYKSEVLFLAGIHPLTPVSRISDDELRAILRSASVLLRRNLGEGPRTTRPTLGGTRLWVYGRRGRPCLRCRTPIVRMMTGRAPGRSTYFCPTCQAERSVEFQAEPRR